MNRLVEEIIKPILEANSKITKVVGIYGGRFQPFGPHHYKTYKWLTKQVDDAYITTSNIKKPPRHPMNFKEKVRHMSKMGVPSNRIIEEKSPYKAINLAKKYNKDTTAFIFIFGQKDAGRLGGKYFKDYKKSKGNINGYEENGYYLVAPHISISVGGKEVSGTSMRELLGSSKIDDKQRAKLFKDMFGYYDKGVFNMITNKFKKLFEVSVTGSIGGGVDNKLRKFTPNNPSIPGAYRKKKKKKKKNEDADMEFKPTSMHYIPSKKRKLKKKHKDGKGQDLLKSQKVNEIDVFEGSLPTKVKDFKKIKKVKPEPDSQKGTYDSTDTFSKHHAGSMGAGDMGSISEPDTYDWDDSGSEPNKGGHQTKKNKKKKGYEPVGEDVRTKKLKGKDGGDYREYDSEEDSDWEEPYKHNIDEFLTTIDMKNIIEESTGATSISTDDGPNIFYSDSKSYKKNTDKLAGKLGWGVLNYIIKGEFKTDNPPIYPNGPISSVTYLPAGAGGEVSPNNQEDLVGTKAWNAWVKHMSKVAQNVGYKLINFTKDSKEDKDAVVKDTKKTQKASKKETPPETKAKLKKESTFSKEWWKEVLNEDERILIDEGVKFNNFIKGWAKKTNQPEEKVKKAMNNKNTFSIAKLNNFSVDDVLENSKKGYNAVANVIKYLPKKAAEKINNTKAGEKKDKLLKKADDWLKKHPKTKRAVMLGAAGAVTYMWTQMTFIGEPEYDFDLSGVAGAAAGTATLGDLFGGTSGTKFLGLFATAKATGLSFPYPGKNLAKFAVGITYGAYKLKKHKDKQRALDVVKGKEHKLDGLPKKVPNPNPDGWRKSINVNSAISWVSKNKGSGKAKKYVKSLKNQESFTTDWWKDLLVEGGAYGHMAHPFDDKDLTFGDLKKIIESGLGGTLNREDNVTEKLDGQNIMISWKDGKLIAARNKGHIKNGGKTALDTKGIMSKFKGRGDIRNAFVFAMKDLEKAIKKLSDKQKEKIFNNGYNFMNMEVMWPKSANVIDYDVATLVFHGALKYDDSGTVKGEVAGSGRILAGMIQQINQHIQKKYSIGKPNFLSVPKHQDFGKMKSKFLGKLSKLQSQFGLKESDTLGLYHQKWWETFVYLKWPNDKKDLTDKIKEGLVKRWAFFDKKYSIPMMKKDITDEKQLEWVLKFDKENHAAQVKKNMKPFEELFFEVGAEIMKNVSGWIAANPDKAVQGIKARLDKAITNVKSGGDLKKLNTLKLQLDKLNSIGGVDSIVPSEGIVFKYKGNTYKFTGAFAPINQITGLMSF